MEDLKIWNKRILVIAIVLGAVAIDQAIKLYIATHYELGESRERVVTIAFGTEKLRFIYDRKEQIMSIDRNEMKKGGRGVRRFKLFSDENLSLQLFVDKTAVEVFFQHGEEAASILVFPEKNIQPELRVAADAEIKSLSGRIWELDSFQFNR